MTAEVCASCGAALASNVEKCTYCGTARAAAPGAEDPLDVFVKAMEERLAHAKDANDGLVALGFLAYAVLLIALPFGLVHGASVGWLGALGADVVAACTGFVALGGLVGVAETRAIDGAWETGVKPAIAAYVAEKKLARTDFDTRAAKVLPQDAKLRKFLFAT